MKRFMIPLICLALVLSVIELCSKQVKPSTSVLKITDGKSVVNISIPTLPKQMDRKVKARRGSQWQGMYLSKLLTNNGYNLKKYHNCILVARDGMRVTIPIEEITDDNALITFAKEKKSMGKDLKLVMLQDTFEQRWLKYINQIILE
ncbi:MAG TPA: hypothetical protein PLE74_07475 [Candidatus Cloacimonadota bacterium]|nr:hypothetical protein [Candidatus Cloacimonadota bacterium]HPT72107.1 hypothetical protein [Candidatus Cloacimonadota bacterium]